MADKPFKENANKAKKDEPCDFGIVEFNKNKRSKAFVEEIKKVERAEKEKAKKNKEKDKDKDKDKGGKEEESSSPPPAEAATPYSLLTTQLPGGFTNDGVLYELGMKWKSAVAGSVTGIRFYKPSGVTGIHTGRLWSANGTLIASVTFTNETASGWQTQSFITPVSVVANTVYTVSVNIATKLFPFTLNVFGSVITNQMLSSVADGNNAVYAVGAGNFPNKSYQNANYFRDVVFVENGPDTIAPSAPANITAIVISASQVNLSWLPFTDNVGVVGYKVFRNGIQIATVTSGTTYSNTGLTGSTTYSYYVTAYDAANNNSAPSTTVTVVTNLPPPSPPPPPPVGSAVILLDFDGHTVSGTSWNSVGNIVCEDSGLTLTEQQNIIDSVKQDFSPFSVVITTDQAVFNAAPLNKRSRLVITDSWEWYGQAGGVSFVGTFGTNDGVSFVFSSLLGYNLKYIREAVSHEIGHQFGNFHQSTYDANCNKLSEYNRGNSSFAPIMGVGYYAAIADWIVGTNSLSCTTIQDDAAVIRNKLG